MQMLHKMTVVCVRVCGECAYIAFCEKFALALIPASIETLGFLVASLSQDCSTSTICTYYLAAIRSLHILFGLSIDQFTSPFVGCVMWAELDCCDP